MTNAELITLLKEAREYVESFAVAGADSTASIASFKVDLPKDGFPRQWAVEAAPETLAHIDAALAAHAREVEEQKAHSDRLWWDALHQASREGLDLSETERRANAAVEAEAVRTAVAAAKGLR